MNTDENLTSASKNGKQTPPFPGIRLTTNGNQLVSYYTEARVTDGGVFYPITPSTEMGENYQLSFAEGNLNVFGDSKIAIEAEGEHAAQGGAIALSVTGKRVVNFTSGQGLVYGVEQDYHAPGKLSTMVLQVAARALTKHALNVHCGHDDIYTALDTGWTMLFAKDAQQAADQALILRKVNELALNPGINIQDGFLTSHLERSFYRHESELMRRFLGRADDEIECPTEAQRTLFGPTRRRVPSMIDLENPMLLGPVQNQEHYMNGVIARRNNFSESILGFLTEAYEEFGELTGRHYGLISEYRTEDAETVFISLGSAAENIEAAVDHLRAEEDAKVGSIHVNVLRPFPEAALIESLAGKQQVIVLERTDEPLAGANPLARDLRTALGKALENSTADCHADLPAVDCDRLPRIFNGSYGLGSRDFRPEGVLGAYEFVTGRTARTDGKTAADGASYFCLGIDHPYAVESERQPSLLPDQAIAVRLHSIGGWGMITTGKNLGEIIGAFDADLSAQRQELDAGGHQKEVLHVSANPKYGSEKKGAPTAYFLVVAPERIRVNCDLRHVTVVLCCDPKAFTHSNPLAGIAEGGTFVWESNEEPDVAWQRIPPGLRQEVIDKKIRIFVLPGFDIARQATSREDLQMRMQGNALLGAFFGVSSLLQDYDISEERFHEVVRAQYVKKFGRFGDAVVDSNMTVMTEGVRRVREVPCGDLHAADRSSMHSLPLVPMNNGSCGISCAPPEGQAPRIPLTRLETFDREFRAGLGYDQPASPLASVSFGATATGATASKYVARRETPLWIAENCTQCMECISACPDTALPNTAQDISTILQAACAGYLTDTTDQATALAAVPTMEANLRAQMLTHVKAKETDHAFKELVCAELKTVEGLSEAGQAQLAEVFERIPLAYGKAAPIFKTIEKKSPGDGGLFAIFVSDLCKGCGECVVECGEHEALVMVSETEELNADHFSGTNFMGLLPDTPQKYLGRFDNDDPLASHQAALRNHLMVRSHYEALVSGDGACAGCGEKTVLHVLASLTEAYMRPLYHARAERLEAKAAELESAGADRLSTFSTEQRALFSKAVAHSLMGLGGDSPADTEARLAEHGDISDEDLIGAICAVLRADAFRHRDLQAIDGRLANGMSVMAMGAHTGCNTVYGSTPPNTPHTYPWMNSLFQDGVTVSWLFGESFIIDHARRSVVPERLCDALLGGIGVTESAYYDLTHMTDTLMTDLEVAELPKAWAIGGDGGMGDIGYQNVSKVVMQNRPNVKVLMLDTQLYSNTGGQNSDSTPMPGGSDMNSFGEFTQGKLTEKKNVAETFISGHGSPFIAQVSMANSAKLMRSLLEALAYRGAAFIQTFTTCQPEHGVGDAQATVQASRARDSRSMPEFVFDPSMGESFGDTLLLKGNPAPERDWGEVRSKARGGRYLYTVAHYAATEARFRRHLKPLKGNAGDYTALEDKLLAITQSDVTGRRFLNESHRAFIPDFGCWLEIDDEKGGTQEVLLSRQLVLFCVERRRAWRMLQSKAGIDNPDYRAQRAALRRWDEEHQSGAVDHAALRGIFAQELETLLPKKKAAAAV